MLCIGRADENHLYCRLSLYGKRLTLIPSLSESGTMTLSSGRSQAQTDQSPQRLRLRQQMDVALQRLLRHFTDHFGDNDALPIEKKGLGNGGDAVVDRGGAGAIDHVVGGNPVGA